MLPNYGLEYIEYVSTVILFLSAERTGDWHLHLVSLKKMLILFIASGQRNCAKSASLICLIGIYSMQSGTVTERHGVTRKRST